MYLCKMLLNKILSGMLLINVSKRYWDRWDLQEKTEEEVESKKEGDNKKC